MSDDPTKTVRRRELPPILTRKQLLRVVHTPDRSALGATFELDGTSYLIGRTVSGPGAIADSMISREHVKLSRGDRGLYVVEDLGGSNGTLLDGARVEGSAPLLPNSVLNIGDTLLVVDSEPNPDLLPAS